MAQPLVDLGNLHLLKSLEHTFAYFEEVVFIFGDGLEDLVNKLGVVLMELLDRFYLAYDVILA
jgi:hypothetical protein